MAYWEHALAKYQILIISIALLAESASAAHVSKLLISPDELHAVPTVLRSSSAVVREGDNLYLFGPKAEQYVKIPFHPEAKTRTARFGEYTQSTRIPVPQ